MLTWLILFCGCICLGLVSSEGGDIYALGSYTIHEDRISWERFRGGVSLIVNTAFRDGHTDGHMAGLAAMQDKLSKVGPFQVIAFPCLAFPQPYTHGIEEPTYNKDILAYAEKNFEINFHLMALCYCNGDEAHPVYKELKNQWGTFPKWNFWKYLVNGEGKVVKAWSCEVPPDEIMDEVEKEVIKAAHKKREDI